MYVWNRLKDDPSLLVDGVRNPDRVALELIRLYYQFRQGQAYNTDGIDVFADEDWDNLILLDACRYDAYRAVNPFDSDPESRVSAGSASEQFVKGNFGGKTLHDVVYVSGNQWFLHLKDQLNCELHYYHDVERDVMDGYVPSPEAVTSATRQIAKRFPDKRLVVHYMQPHKPYLGANRECFTYEGGLGTTMQASDATDRQLRTAYRSNLELVLKSARKLIRTLDGKTVISSDHGELLGERLPPSPFRTYGHPSAVYADTLVTVPWHVVSEGPRKEIRADPPVSDADPVDRQQVETRLKDLGYL